MRSTGKKISIKKRFCRDWDLYLLIIPGVLWFLFFAYKPMLGLSTAFYDYNIFKGISGSKFVGFDNFRQGLIKRFGVQRVAWDKRFGTGEDKFLACMYALGYNEFAVSGSHLPRPPRMRFAIPFAVYRPQ